jgi:type II secretory pathway component GspD/PulD (secretin)
MKRRSTIAFCCLVALLPLPSRSTDATNLSLDVRDVDIYDAVRLISTQGETNVVVDSSVTHRPITLRLQNVSFDEALKTLARSNDLESVRVGNVVYLGTADDINRRYASRDGATSGPRSFHLSSADPDDIARSLSGALPNGTLILPDRRSSTIMVVGSADVLTRATTLIRSLDRPTDATDVSLTMHYIKASDALKAVEATLPVVPPSTVYASDQQNALVLVGTSNFIARASSIVDRIDKPGQQVRYEVRVTDLTPTESSNIGFLFGGVDENGQPQAGSGSTVTSFLRNSLAVNATINALVTKGEARILARPSISSLNNVQASLLVGEQYPIVYFDARTGTQQVQFVNIGVNLSVTPTIGVDGAITTDLETDYSQVTGTIANFPIVTTRKAQSTLRVRDGETIVIAGLFSDVDRSTMTKVPFLGDIPFLGEIFRNRMRDRSKDEVVFLITPHLVRDNTSSEATHDSAAPASW